MMNSVSRFMPSQAIQNQLIRAAVTTATAAIVATLCSSIFASMTPLSGALLLASYSIASMVTRMGTDSLNRGGRSNSVLNILASMSAVCAVAFVVFPYLGMPALTMTTVVVFTLINLQAVDWMYVAKHSFFGR
jgi:hypothetical protein